MKVLINIHEQVNGDIFIKEISLQEKKYAESLAQQTKDKVLFEQSASICVIKKITSEKEEILYAFVHDHKVNDVVNKAVVKTDGWYKIWQFIIPNKKWLDWAVGNNMLSGYDTVYIVDDNKLYKYDAETLSEVAIENLLADKTVNNVWHIEKDTFVIFNLWQCYLNYCKKMLNNECSDTSKCDNTCDDEMTKNRSLIWLFLNVIQYYIHFGMFDEAQKFLESITGGCNTLCQNEMFTKDYDCKCGKV